MSELNDRNPRNQEARALPIAQVALAELGGHVVFLALCLHRESRDNTRAGAVKLAVVSVHLTSLAKKPLQHHRFLASELSQPVSVSYWAAPCRMDFCMFDVVLARAVRDPHLSDEILSSVRQKLR